MIQAIANYFFGSVEIHVPVFEQPPKRRLPSFVEGSSYFEPRSAPGLHKVYCRQSRMWHYWYVRGSQPQVMPEYKQPKPRPTSCPNCGAPWEPVCSYCRSKLT